MPLDAFAWLAIVVDGEAEERRQIECDICGIAMGQVAR
jgi:hypothetical protein